MSIPKEPRQLMVNIMYLVLTALLALNVSAEILKAFHNVDRGMRDANNILDTSNDITHASILQATKHDEGADETLVSVQLTRQYAREMASYLELLRDSLIEASGGWQMKDGRKIKLKGEGDTETTSRIMVSQGRGDELRSKILECRNRFQELYASANPAVQQELTASITLGAGILAHEKGESEGAQEKDWKTSNFYKVPLAGVLPILTSLESDVKRTESVLLNYYFKKLTDGFYTVDHLGAQVAAEARYLRKGQQFSADIFLGASSSKAAPLVYVGKLDREVKPEADGRFAAIKGKTEAELPLENARQLDVDPLTGRAKFEEVASGKRVIEGVVQVRQPGGSDLWDFYPFKFEYEAYESSSVVISPTGMNVLYLGIENPISITAGEAAPETVRASGCGIRRASDGSFLATPSGAPRKELIKVAGRTPDGDAVKGEMEFRIKRIPDPDIYIGSKKEGAIRKAELIAQQGVIAKNDDFDFAVNYKVKEFTVRANINGRVISETVRGNRFNDNCREIFRRLGINDYIYFTDVQVKTPDGTTRMGSVNFRIM